MASFLNTIIGTPFSTPVGQLIEKTTSSPHENWALYMEICDRINSTEEGPRDAIRAFKRQLSSTTANTHTFLTTLVVLETCVKNCGHRFHMHLSQRDFLQEFTKILIQKATPPVHCVDRVLSLLQTWADAFQGDPSLREMEITCKELKVKGFEFPVEDVEHAPPIHTPARKFLPTTKPLPPIISTSLLLPKKTNGDTLQPTPSSPILLSHTTSTTAKTVTIENPSSMEPHLASSTHPSIPLSIHPSPPSSIPPSTPPSIAPAQMTKLRAELNVVLQNCRVFSELISDNSPGQESQEDWLLMKDLAGTSSECHGRLVELVGNYTIEELTVLVLPVNDEVTNVSLRFERYQRSRKNIMEKSGRPVSAVAAANVAAIGITAAGGMFAAADDLRTANTTVDPKAAGLVYEDEELVEVTAESDSILAGNTFNTAPTASQDSFHPFVNPLPHCTSINDSPGEVETSKLKTSSNKNHLSSDTHTNQQESASSQDFDNFLASRTSNQLPINQDPTSHSPNQSNEEREDFTHHSPNQSNDEREDSTHHSPNQSNEERENSTHQSPNQSNEEREASRDGD